MSINSCSIIVSTFNRLDYLKKCVPSLLALDFENYEIIIINDCSTDGTKEYSLKRINLVWAVYDTLQEVKAVEIIDNDGSKLALRFAPENDDYGYQHDLSVNAL